ncbi:family 1 glycosylhydrolase [Paracoccus sp. S1E-3]|uniref:family 1 glycosylhydrolase n=1 Tax=Paracoccus sp. S1E-3 TaxID=2756130 RepID=UPI0015EF7CAA|nr:family 1 glycosylhydrolase [Paracoccus sp. S1E-3]MBA4489180.1 family 1 glycosylhydrolase [Paracoccus sp. S1E-3]
MSKVADVEAWRFSGRFPVRRATAACHIEGRRFGGAGSGQWHRFAATPGNVAGGSAGAAGEDHLHRRPEDLHLIRAGGFDARRFSTRWARVMFDDAGLNAGGLRDNRAAAHVAYACFTCTRLMRSRCGSRVPIATAIRDRAEFRNRPSLHAQVSRLPLCVTENGLDRDERRRGRPR